jgi:hypothetical protein
MQCLVSPLFCSFYTSLYFFEGIEAIEAKCNNGEGGDGDDVPFGRHSMQSMQLKIENSGSIEVSAENGNVKCTCSHNKTENLSSPYPRSESDINWYTRLKIAMSCYLQGKLAILPAYGRLLRPIFLQGCRARLHGKGAICAVW